MECLEVLGFTSQNVPQRLQSHLQAVRAAQPRQSHFIMSVTTSGTIVAPYIDNPGKGYTANPVVTISNITGCSATPVVVALTTRRTGSSGTTTGVFIQIQQHDTGAAVWTIFPTPNLPLDSVINAVTAATVSGGSGGTGYAVNDTINLANGTQVKVTAVSGGVITTVSINSGGNWQCYTASARSPSL